VPAHITVLYPFKRPDGIDGAVHDDLRRCFSRFSSFDFTLTAIRRFSDEVLYLAPEPEEPFRQLTLAVWGYSPETPPYGGRFSEIVPHLTIAQPRNGRPLSEIVREFKDASRGALPIHARASEVTLIDTMSGRWRISATFRLSEAGRG
jgi:2'-5' RNA ligase